MPSGWTIAICCYVGLLAVTFLPAFRSIRTPIKPHDGGPGPEASKRFSADTKAALVSSHERFRGTLGFWKHEADVYKHLHYYMLGWVIPGTIMIPLLPHALTEDPASKWFLSIVSGASALLLAFHRWLKIEPNYKAYRLAESSYYDLRRRMLDRPGTFGVSEPDQLDGYFATLEEMRSRFRDAEIDNFPGSDLPSVNEIHVALNQTPNAKPKNKDA